MVCKVAHASNPACLAVKLGSTKRSFSLLRLLKICLMRRFKPTKSKPFKYRTMVMALPELSRLSLTINVLPSVVCWICASKPMRPLKN